MIEPCLLVQSKLGSESAVRVALGTVVVLSPASFCWEGHSTALKKQS